MTPLEMLGGGVNSRIRITVEIETMDLCPMAGLSEFMLRLQRLYPEALLVEWRGEAITPEPKEYEMVRGRLYEVEA